ncbi:MAG TPA: S8 family serine peptidase [Bryobacteraceae bacterium]|nr:S8 family serine peptidase [Bryobacteraceae bacterium]
MPSGKVHRALSSAVLGAIFCASAALAQHPATHKPQHQTQKPKEPRISHTRRGGLAYVPNRYMLFLSDQPVAAHFARQDQLQTQAAIAYRQQVESRQASVMRDLAGRNFQVVGSASMVMNAVFVVATPDRLAELRSVSGVIGVMPERRVRPSLNKATTLANAPAAWAQAAIGGQSNAGHGIRIGIIDSGIDVSNPAFKDTGFTAPAGFPKCNAAVPGTPSDCGLYTNNKVIVARSYISMMAFGNCGGASQTGACASAGTATAATSIPDDYSARDRDGHGSGTAASAGAVQNSAGSVAFSGMAPGAYLGSYKIFGSEGVSFEGAPESVIIKALDDAVSDGMNVISASFGTSAVAGAKDDVQCGNAAGVWCDPLAHAFETAAENGTVVVVSAGNYGSDPYTDPYYNTITSPGSAPSVITVGATINSHVFNPSVTVNGSGAPANLKGIAAAISDSAFYPSVVGANSGVLIDVTKLGDNGQACSALPAGSLTDDYALVQRSPSTGSGCSFDTKAQNVSAAGGIGIVFYMADTTALVAPGQICYTNPSGACDLYGPGVMISLADGQNLKAYIDANPNTTVTIDTAGAEEALPNTSSVNTLASYSSVGPAIDGTIKPDIVATGGFDGYQSLSPSATNGLYTAGESYDPNGVLFSTNGFAAANGTSFSAPLVAGAAAMVLQAHPTWTALQVKSALVNYAAQTVTSDDNGNTVDVQQIGGGLLDANAAVTASVTAVPSTLSFGYVSSKTTLPLTIPVTVQNNGSQSVTLAVAVTATDAATGATVKTDQSSLTLAAGAKATLNVSLNGAAPAPGEYSGAVTLTSSTPAIALRMPYEFLVSDGNVDFVNPLYDLSDWQNYDGTFAYGAVNQDMGPLPVQALDQFGVPLAGVSIVYTVTPSGTLNLQAIPGKAGSTGNVVPFQPSNCTPSSSGSTLTCTTNNYGIAWVELVNGSTAVGSTNASTVDATESTSGADITDYVSIIPVPGLTSVYENNAGGATIAPGSYIQMAGSNFADPNFLADPTNGDKVDVTYSSGRLPLVWDYVTVSFDAPASGSLPAISVPGYVEYVSTGKINVWVPWELEGYPSVNVKEIYQGTAAIFSNVLNVPLSTYTPTFFMYPSGSVLIADALDNNTGALITTSNPATAGEILQLYCNGLGPTTNQPASGDPAPSGSLSQLAQTTTPVTVSIGGQNVTPIFAGLDPPYVGLYLVDVTVPSGLSSGNQPITVSVGGKTSPTSVATYQIVLPIK